MEDLILQPGALMGVVCWCYCFSAAGFCLSLDCCWNRHGVPGGSSWRSQPSPPGARRRKRSHHNLLLKISKNNNVIILMPITAHKGMLLWVPVNRHFWGKQPNLFCMKGRVPPVPDEESERHQDKRNSVTDWKLEHSVCTRVTEPLHRKTETLYICCLT